MQQQLAQVPARGCVSTSCPQSSRPSLWPCWKFSRSETLPAGRTRPKAQLQQELAQVWHAAGVRQLPSARQAQPHGPAGLINRSDALLAGRRRRPKAQPQQQLAQVRRAPRVHQLPAAEQAQQLACGRLKVPRDVGDLIGGSARIGRRPARWRTSCRPVRGLRTPLRPIDSQ